MDSSLYPLKFEPILKDKIWGGNRLKTVLNKKISEANQCGESWEISGLVGDESMIVNGFLAENNLNELLEIYMTELVGEKNYEQYGLGFPLLIKFIDAQDNLSVQVHPDDAYAARVEGKQGKTEAWHILFAAPGAELVFGVHSR